MALRNNVKLRFDGVTNQMLNMGSHFGLSLAEVYSLNAVFTDEENHTFEERANSFRQAFNHVKDPFRLGLAISSLLKQPDVLPKPTQRLVALYLLFSMYPPSEITNLSHHPFTSTFLSLMKAKVSDDSDLATQSGFCEVPAVTRHERYFLTQLLQGHTKDLSKKTPKMIVTIENIPQQSWDSTVLENEVQEIQKHYSMTSRVGIPLLVPVPDEKVAKDISYSEQQGSLKTWEQMFEVKDPQNETRIPAAFGSLVPEYLRPDAPLHEGENEYIWLDPMELEEFLPLWNPDMLIEESETSPSPSNKSSPEKSQSGSKGSSNLGSESGSKAGSLSGDSPKKIFSSSVTLGEKLEGAKSSDGAEGGGSSSDSSSWDRYQMLDKAITTQLTAPELSWLQDSIRETDASIVQKVGMTPEKLPSLVEANPLIAVEVILKLLPSKEISTYFETLICMDLSVHGMEVVNRLTTHVILPSEFLHLYVTNCISSCEQMKENSLSQNRLVRLVCVFLQALIRNRVINAQDLHIELQAFCINFSRIREAAALFRVVQQMNNSADAGGADGVDDDAGVGDVD